jgi:hypothetical protein
MRIKSSKIKWARHIARMGESWNACRVLVGKPVGRPGCRWEDNIEINLWEIGWGGMDWIHVDNDRNQWRALVNTVTNLGFHKMSGKSVSG